MACLICETAKMLQIKLSTPNPVIRLYPFPKPEKRRIQWEKQVRKIFPTLKTFTGCFICSTHFSDDDINPKTGLLMKNAVPFLSENIMEGIAEKKLDLYTPLDKLTQPEVVDLSIKSIDVQLNLGEVCRICLLDVGSGGRLLTAKDYDIITQADLEIPVATSLPDQICQSCLNDLADGVNYRFRMNLDTTNALVPYLTTAQINVAEYQIKVLPKLAQLNVEGCSTLLGENTIVVKAVKRERKRRFRPKLQPFVCHLCGREYQQKNEMRIHMEYKHLRIRTFLCDMCEKSFFYMKELKRHILTRHTSKRNLKMARGKTKDPEPKVSCPYCSKLISQNVFKYHTRRHLGQLPHKCNKCDKAYVKPSELTKHFTLAHTDASFREEFECCYCEQKFPYVWKYKSHTATCHPEIRDFPFGCSICSKEFLFANSLNAHKNKFHNQEKSAIKKAKPTEPLPCPQCGKMLKSVQTFNKHMKMHERYRALIGNVEDYLVD